MIKINLLGEKVDNSGEYLLQTFIFGSTITAAVICCAILQWNGSQSLTQLNEEKITLESKLLELKKVTRKVENLESNQKLLKEKLNTISALKLKKRGPVRVLEDLRASVPEKVWLSSVKQKSGALEINGMSLDNQTISEFMGNLEKTNYFGKIDLIHSTQKEKDKIKLKQFLLLAQLKDPLSMARKSAEVSADVGADKAAVGKDLKKVAVKSQS